MATLREYFDTDFHKYLKVTNTMTLSSAKNKINILTNVHQDFDSNTKYLQEIRMSVFRT